MHRFLELLFFLLAMITGIASVILYVASIFRFDFLYKQLDKPGNLRRTRTTCRLMFICIILLVISKLAKLVPFFIQTNSIKPPTVSSLAIQWLGVILFLLFYIKYFRYYLKQHNDHITLAGWHIRKHFSLIKKKDYASAYDHLKAAEELRPKDISTKCILAKYNECFLENPQQTDNYLNDVKKIIDSTTVPNPKDQAILQSTLGFINQLRNNHPQAIKDFEKALSFDPTKHRKKEYNNALHKLKQSQVGGFTITELVAVLILITLFYIGYKTSSHFLMSHLPEYKGKNWYVILALTAPIACGLFLDVTFVACSMWIGMTIEKKKKKNSKLDKND